MSSQQDTPFTPHAALLAWLWPGAGHIALGERARGFGIMTGILLLVILGVLIGGIDCVDRKEDRLWFLAQSLNGPIALGIDYLNQNVIKAKSAEQRLWTTGISHVNEVGTLYIALAGLMNLAVILDALQFTPRMPPRPKRRSDDGGADVDAAGEGSA